MRLHRSYEFARPHCTATDELIQIHYSHGNAHHVRILMRVKVSVSGLVCGVFRGGWDLEGTSRAGGDGELAHLFLKLFLLRAKIVPLLGRLYAAVCTSN